MQSNWSAVVSVAPVSGQAVKPTHFSTKEVIARRDAAGNLDCVQALGIVHSGYTPGCSVETIFLDLKPAETRDIRLSCVGDSKARSEGKLKSVVEVNCTLRDKRL